MAITKLKRIVVTGTILLAGLVGGLTCCEKEEEEKATEEAEESTPYEQQLEIEGELQWASGLDWTYIPQDGDSENEKIGCFVEGSGETSGEMIKVFHKTLPEEDFFVLIGEFAEKLQEIYPEEKIFYRINGDAKIDQVVQLDTEKEHYLFLRYQDSVYILGGKMEKKTWRTFFTAWLFDADLKWDGLTVMKQGKYVWYDRMEKAPLITLHWDGDWIPVEGEVLLFHKQGNGFYLKRVLEDEEESLVEEVILRPTDICLTHNSWEDAISYFRDRYPDMYSLEAKIYGEHTVWDYKEDSLDRIFYKVKEEKGIHGFFSWNRNVCEVFSLGKEEEKNYDFFTWKGRIGETSSWGSDGYSNMVDTVRDAAGFDYYPCFIWEGEADGSMAYSDHLQRKFFYREDLGDGNAIRLQAEIVDVIEDEGTVIYGVEIFDEK